MDAKRAVLLVTLLAGCGADGSQCESRECVSTPGTVSLAVQNASHERHVGGIDAQPGRLYTVPR